MSLKRKRGDNDDGIQITKVKDRKMDNSNKLIYNHETCTVTFANSRVDNTEDQKKLEFFKKMMNMANTAKNKNSYS
jgi:hypothetical protein